MNSTSFAFPTRVRIAFRIVAFALSRRLARQGYLNVTTAADGRWMVKLAPQPATTRPLTLTATGKNSVKIDDILLGDVWLCSGQSNMDWALGGCQAPEDIATATLPLIRASIRLEDAAWVCADAFIGPGVTVGEGAVVGARAVVMRDVPAWQVVAGNPACVIRKRVIKPSGQTITRPRKTTSNKS